VTPDDDLSEYYKMSMELYQIYYKYEA